VACLGAEPSTRDRCRRDARAFPFVASRAKRGGRKHPRSCSSIGARSDPTDTGAFAAATGLADHRVPEPEPAGSRQSLPGSTFLPRLSRGAWLRVVMSPLRGRARSGDDVRGCTPVHARVDVHLDCRPVSGCLHERSEQQLGAHRTEHGAVGPVRILRGARQPLRLNGKRRPESTALSRVGFEDLHGRCATVTRTGYISTAWLPAARGRRVRGARWSLLSRGDVRSRGRRPERSRSGTSRLQPSGLPSRRIRSSPNRSSRARKTAVLLNGGGGSPIRDVGSSPAWTSSPLLATRRLRRQQFSGT